MSDEAAAADRRILIVEDEAIVARDLERSLERMGYTVAGVEAHGEDAIARAERDRPALVLMDIRLRGAVDGIEAAAEIWRRLGVPSVFLTAYADDETVARALQAGSFGYLVKPFEPRELRATIEIALRRGREGRAALEREARLFDLLTALGDAVVRVDAEGRVARANAAAERLLGRTAVDMVAEATVAATIFGDGADAAVIRPPSGEPIAVRICRLPVAGPSGRAELIVFHEPNSAIDGERRLLRREVSAQLQQLVSGVVHGVGNPLFVMSSQLDLMALELGAAPAGGEAVDRIRGQIDRIRSLLVYLTQYAGGEPAQRRRVAVATILADAVAAAATRAAERGLRLDLEDLSGATEAEVDAAAVRNACDHLISNAIDFSPAGGSIRIRLLGVAGATGAIDGSALLCEFDNDGPTIAGDDLERIFTPFFSRRRQGAGLGLAVVRRVVEDHGGRISAANRDDGGVRFTISLPLRS